MAPAADEDTRIRRALARALDVAEDRITPASSAANLEPWTEAAQPTVVAELETEFGVRFDKRSGDRLLNLAAIRTALAELRAPAQAAPTGALARLDAEPGAGRVVVLGDDHVATLARHPAFLPVSLGSPWRIHFLALRQASQAAAKIAQLVARLPEDTTVVLYFGGAVEPLGDPAFRSMWHLAGEADGELIDTAVTRLLDTAEAIRKRCGGGLALAAVPPATVDGPGARRRQRYNERLAEAGRERGVPVFSVAAYATDNLGYLRPGFLADEARLSSAAAPFFADELAALGLLRAQPELDDTPNFAWRYGYRRFTPAGPVEIPGEDSLGERADQPLDDFGEVAAAGPCAPEEAALQPGSKACLAALREATALHGYLGVEVGRDLDVLVLDCGEGLPALFYPRGGTNRLVALDRDPRRIQLARRLARLFDRGGIAFDAVADYGGVAGLPPVDLALVLDRADAPPTWLKALFARLQPVAGAVLHRSRRPQADAAVLSRAGFARAVPWPFLGDHRPGYLDREGPAAGGLGRSGASDSLLLGLREPPSPELAERLRAHLQAGFEDHARALEERFAAVYDASLAPVSA